MRPHAKRRQDRTPAKIFPYDPQSVVQDDRKADRTSCHRQEVIQRAQKGNISFGGPAPLHPSSLPRRTMDSGDPSLQRSTYEMPGLRHPQGSGSNYPTVPLGNLISVRLQDSVCDGFPASAYSWATNPLVSAESNFEFGYHAPSSCCQNWRDRRPAAAVVRRITHVTRRPPPSRSGSNAESPLPGPTSRVSTSLFPSTGPWNSSTRPAVRKLAHYDTVSARAVFVPGQFRKSITESTTSGIQCPDCQRQIPPSAVVASVTTSVLTKTVDHWNLFPYMPAGLVYACHARVSFFLPTCTSHATYNGQDSFPPGPVRCY